MTKTISADIGTTNTCAGVWLNGRAETFVLRGEQRILPSVVCFTDNENETLVGYSAIAEGKNRPQFCHRNIKRLRGRAWNDREDTGPKTVEGDDGMTWLRCHDRNRSPDEVEAYIAMAIVEAAELRLGFRPDRIALTVPASFQEPERRATREIAHRAYFEPENVFLINEPTAAAIAHGHTLDKHANIVVGDLGGGTLDITVFKTGGGGVEVMSSKGDSSIGGVHFDERIVRRVVKAFFNRHGIDLSLRADAMDRVREAAEEAKKALTENEEASVQVEFVVTDGPDGVINMDETITRAEFEEEIADLLDDMMAVCQNALDGANITKEKIDALILVGGQTLSPVVRRRFAEFFGREPEGGQNPKEVVALGAAMWAASLDGITDQIKMIDKTSHTIGVERAGGGVFEVFPAGTAYPVTKVVPFTNARDNIESLSIHVLQGNHFRADHNRLLAHAERPCDQMDAGENMLEVTFDLDRSGTLTVFDEHGEIYSGIGV